MDIKNNKGIILPIVLLALVILTIFGTTILFITSSQAKFNYADDSSKNALEYAEAGYNAYLWHLNDDVNFYSTEKHKKMMNTPIAFQDGYYMLEVTKPSDTDRFITIKSTGWTKDSPEIKRTIVAKIRKKQFVHHVYVSDNDGKEIWWTTGDESHGPYHTNKDLYIRDAPVFYDTVSYSRKLKKGSSYKPDFKVREPKQPEFLKDGLEFPKDNSELKKWAEKDNMVFYGRTCIYIDGDNVKIRNGNAKKEDIYTIAISNIKNKVIYVDGNTERINSKFDLEAGNIFISGKLKGQLTIGAANNIYITTTDPTNWDIYPSNTINGGVVYKSTTFSPSDKLSYEDKEKGIWTRDAEGKDMLGLVAQNDIMILHYGWPKYKKDNRDTEYWDEKHWEWYYDRRGDVLARRVLVDVAPQNITIHAAIFAVKGGFCYEDYDYGIRKGDITLWGNITQKERKPVGLIDTTGYNKKYAHDPRMFYDYPPHILEPTNVGWEVHDWRETDEHVKEK